MQTGPIDKRTNAQKRVCPMLAPHQRLWWMELTRGLLTFVVGLFFLTARSFAPWLFLYCLGSYLVIDGLLELYGVRKRNGVSQLRPLDYAGGVASLLSGLLSFVLPTLTLLFFVGIIAVHLILRSSTQIRTARHARGPTIALLWIYSCSFVLLGLFLLLFPLLAITFLIIFLGSYMVVAGLFLLLRGIALRFTSSSHPSSFSLPPQASQDLSDDLPASTRRAVVFVRRSAANGLGHIAWGFEWMNGWFNLGSVENFKGKPFANPAAMDFWSTHTLDPMTTIQNRAHPYDEYKCFFVPQPRPKDAWKTVIWESQQPYSFVHHNCCDVAYEVLGAYGCTELLDPGKEFVPNDWYDALPGRSYTIAALPSFPVCLHKQSRREIATREITLVIPPQMKGSPPRRMPGWRTWEELTLMWEMMIGHVLTVLTSGIKLIAQLVHVGGQGR
jgi:uncharacterized membrane protein HdeD (DUF308 family)